MVRPALTTWLVSLALGAGGPAAAQDSPPDPTGRIVPEFAADPGGRRGSPAETLEALTRGSAGEDAEGREIETDRDSFTPATTTAPRRRLITEAAYTFADNRRFKETHSFPELLLRYGLTDRVEVRFGFNYEVGGEGGDVSGFGAAGGGGAEGGLERVSQLSYGLKLQVSEQRHWLPRTAVIVQAATPTSGRDNLTDLIVGLVGGWELPNRWRFDASLRYSRVNEPADRYDLWAPSAVLRVPVGERWAVHAEYFGTFSADRSENFARHYFSPGAHYLVTRDLEVGVRVGWGLNDQSPRFFVNAGFGWQY